jgi:signal transduction histidine kinase
VEAVGYPELSGAAPVLRSAVARNIGHAPLPQPKVLASDDLIRSSLDATRVRISGVLQGLTRTQTDSVLEMRSGSWRFLARLNAARSEQLPSIGSRLELTGVYCAQGGLAVLGEDVAPVDILLGGVSDITVLARPPWWTLQRLLVIVGLLVCALAGTVLWIKQLRRQVEERSAELATQIRNRQKLEHQRSLEQERIRIAQDLHDELGSDIATISMLAARAQIPSAPEEKRSESLEQVRGKAKEMVGALDEIVWAMNPGHDSVAGLMSYVDRYASRFLGLANMAWHFDGVPEIANRTLDSRQRHHLFMVLKETLTNIVRHSAATEVRASVEINENELELFIIDNGRGLTNGEHSEESNGHANGLTNMRSRIEKLNGRFEISGKPGRGTEVRFVLPVN